MSGWSQSTLLALHLICTFKVHFFRDLFKKDQSSVAQAWTHLASLNTYYRLMCLITLLASFKPNLISQQPAITLKRPVRLIKNGCHVAEERTVAQDTSSAPSKSKRSNDGCVCHTYGICVMWGVIPSKCFRAVLRWLVWESQLRAASPLALGHTLH